MKMVFKIGNLTPRQLTMLRAGFMMSELVHLIETQNPEVDFRIGMELFLGSLKPEIVEAFIGDSRVPTEVREVWEKIKLETPK